MLCSTAAVVGSGGGGGGGVGSETGRGDGGAGGGSEGAAVRAELGAEADGALRQAVPQLADSEGLLASLRQLLEGRYPPDGNLRENLDSVGVDDAVLVPVALKLGHAGSVYELLESLL